MAAITAFGLARRLLRYTRGPIGKLFFAVRSHLYDVFYFTISESQLNDLLEYWRLEVLPTLSYTPESFDCDDFAFSFKALAVMRTGRNCALFAGGRIYRGGEFLGMHAYNVVLTDGRVVFVEPQTGEPLSEEDGKAVSPDGFEYGLLFVVG